MIEYLTQKEIAKRLNVAPKTVYNWFRGYWNNGRKTLEEVREIVYNNFPKRIIKQFDDSGMFNELDPILEDYDDITPEVKCDIKKGKITINITIEIKF